MGAASEPPAAPRIEPERRRPLTARFYDVGQGLAVLVELPDGRHILVDAGDDPRRPGCQECEQESRHLLDGLRQDLGQAKIDLMWITHQHSDHIGGAREVLEAFEVATYVDNGRDGEHPQVREAHRAASRRGTDVRVVDPENRAVPLAGSDGVRITAVAPAAWPHTCARDPNDCSIGLRVEVGSSAILFVGDAGRDEEALIDPGGPVTLLQVGHHGSETASTPAFLSRIRPKYAVISAGPRQGINADYCHPRALVVERLTRVLGGLPSGRIDAFDGARCLRATPSDWVAVPASDRLWATERDGDVTLRTAGDGVFVRSELR
jgi:competence protein ComEC